jgi:hypothetical protein
MPIATITSASANIQRGHSEPNHTHQQTVGSASPHATFRVKHLRLFFLLPSSSNLLLLAYRLRQIDATPGRSHHWPPPSHRSTAAPPLHQKDDHPSGLRSPQAWRSGGELGALWRRSSEENSTRAEGGWTTRDRRGTAQVAERRGGPPGAAADASGRWGWEAKSCFVAVVHRDKR